MIRYRKLELVNDYPILASFFEGSKMGVAPTLDRLPNDGVVACKGYGSDEVIIGGIFLYLCYPMSIIGFPILDPKLDECRDEVVNELIRECEIVSKYNGFVYMNTWSGLPHVQNRLLNNGYEVADTDVIHFIKRL